MGWSPWPLWRSPSIKPRGSAFCRPFLFAISLENAGGSATLLRRQHSGSPKPLKLALLRPVRLRAKSRSLGLLLGVLRTLSGTVPWETLNQNDIGHIQKAFPSWWHYIGGQSERPRALCYQTQGWPRSKRFFGGDRCGRKPLCIGLLLALRVAQSCPGGIKQRSGHKADDVRT